MSAADRQVEGLAIRIVEALRPLVRSCNWEEPHGRESVTVQVVQRELARGLPAGSGPQQDERFARLAELKGNWDSYGGLPIDAAAMERAKAWLRNAAVVPCSDGGVQLEWHSEGCDVEIVFRADGTTEAFAEEIGSRGPQQDVERLTDWDDCEDVPKEAVLAFQRECGNIDPDVVPSYWTVAACLVAAMKALRSGGPTPEGERRTEEMCPVHSFVPLATCECHHGQAVRGAATQPAGDGQ